MWCLCRNLPVPSVALGPLARGDNRRQTSHTQRQADVWTQYHSAERILGAAFREGVCQVSNVDTIVSSDHL